MWPPLGARPRQRKRKVRHKVQGAIRSEHVDFEPHTPRKERARCSGTSCGSVAPDGAYRAPLVPCGRPLLRRGCPLPLPRPPQPASSPTSRSRGPVRKASVLATGSGDPPASPNCSEKTCPRVTTSNQGKMSQRVRRRWHPWCCQSGRGDPTNAATDAAAPTHATPTEVPWASAAGGGQVAGPSGRTPPKAAASATSVGPKPGWPEQ